MTTQQGLWEHGPWVAAAAALALAVLAGIADWRRTHRRRNLDDPGWVPWRGIQAASLFAALLLAGIALQA